MRFGSWGIALKSIVPMPPSPLSMECALNASLAMMRGLSLDQPVAIATLREEQGPEIIRVSSPLMRLSGIHPDRGEDCLRSRDGESARRSLASLEFAGDAMLTDADTLCRRFGKANLKDGYSFRLLDLAQPPSSALS
jgi:hypothetical protein